jgi:hypothetical protein
MTQSGIAPTDMETVLSARGFLKVFQEFEKLPDEEAIEKLYVFSERAIEYFGTSLKDMHYVDVKMDSNMFQQYVEAIRVSPEYVDPTGAKYMLCVSMLLAARMREYELLLYQIEEMQRIVDVCIDRLNGDDTFPSDLKEIMPYVIPLEDDCILTVLMYALKQAGITNIPFEETFIKKTISLFRWDAEATYYDFLSQRGYQQLDPKNETEQFVVYEFPNPGFFDNQKKKAIINTLKECFSK